VNDKSKIKTTYLAVYDYRTGGIWILIDAASPSQVERVYPQLRVVEDQPAWIDEQAMEEIRSKFHFDIDAPKGWITRLDRQDA
jgi:hypothetical protein